MRRLLPLSLLAAGFCVFGLFASAASAAGYRVTLSASLPEVQFSGVAFSDAVDFLRDVSGANIVVNWKALESQGVNKDVPINVRLRNVSLKKALQMVLSEAGADAIGYDVDQNVIEITTREIIDSRLYTRVYPIQDLIMEVPDFIDAPDFSLNSTSNNSSQNPGQSGSNSGGGGGGASLFDGQTKEKASPTKEERAKALIDLIEAIIQPEAWIDNGGKSAIRYFNGNLIVTAPRSIQEAIGGSWN